MIKLTDHKFNRVGIEHPGGQGRSRGEESQAYLQIFTASGQARHVAMSREDLIVLLKTGADVLATLEGVRP